MTDMKSIKCNKSSQTRKNKLDRTAKQASRRAGVPGKQRHRAPCSAEQQTAPRCLTSARRLRRRLALAASWAGKEWGSPLAAVPARRDLLLLSGLCVAAAAWGRDVGLASQRECAVRDWQARREYAVRDWQARSWGATERQAAQTAAASIGCQTETCTSALHSAEVAPSIAPTIAACCCCLLSCLLPPR